MFFMHLEMNNGNIAILDTVEIACTSWIIQGKDRHDVQSDTNFQPTRFTLSFFIFVFLLFSLFFSVDPSLSLQSL